MPHSPCGECDISAGQLARTFSLDIALIVYNSEMAASRSRRCSAAWNSALSSSGLTTVSGFTIFLTITRCLQKRRWTVGDAASATPEGYDWSSTDCRAFPSTSSFDRYWTES